VAVHRTCAMPKMLQSRPSLSPRYRASLQSGVNAHMAAAAAAPTAYRWMGCLRNLTRRQSPWSTFTSMARWSFARTVSTTRGRRQLRGRQRGTRLRVESPQQADEPIGAVESQRRDDVRAENGGRVVVGQHVERQEQEVRVVEELRTRVRPQKHAGGAHLEHAAAEVGHGGNEDDCGEQPGRKADACLVRVRSTLGVARLRIRVCSARGAAGRDAATSYPLKQASQWSKRYVIGLTPGASAQ
jgi:hypothetical protein